MQNLAAKATYVKGHEGVETQLSLVEFKEGATIIIYSPALDLSGYGKTEQEARKSFQETLGEFFRYTLQKNSLLKELKRLGWKIKGGKKHPQVSSPDFSTLIKENKELEKIMEMKEFKKYDQTVDIPMAV